MHRKARRVVMIEELNEREREREKVRLRERNNLKARICHSNELWFKFKARLLFRLHSYCLN